MIDHRSFGFVPVRDNYRTNQRGLEPFTQKTSRDVKPFEEFDLSDDRDQMLFLVISPDQLPPKGRRRTFQIDYQVGKARPVQHFVILAR